MPLQPHFPVHGADASPICLSIADSVGLSFAAAPFDAARHNDEKFRLHGIDLPFPLLRATARRRAEYLAGRRCARQAVAAVTGRWNAPGIGADRAPHWPAGTVGSITHSSGWAAALVGRSENFAGLGLDLEAVMSDDHAQRLQPDILTARETAHFGTNPEEGLGFVTTLIFSLKESLFKALHPIVRRPFYFHDAEVLSLKENGSAYLILLEDLDERWCTNTMLTAQFTILKKTIVTTIILPI